MRKTPFFDFHGQHGAKFVDFAGWEMPLTYGSIQEEHRQVRRAGGLFDVSHMGRIVLRGVHARRLLERVLTRRISDMKESSCRYALICNASGGVIDDVIVYRFTDQWLMVCNASNRDAVLEHLASHVGTWSVKIEDTTEKTAMVALQGPRVMEMIGRFSSEVPTLKRYAFCEKNLLVLKLTISRTGYTGEDGVEVLMGASMASMAIKLLYREAPDDDDALLRPAGLGARDTLRIEAGMPLYGHELDLNTDPIAAGLDFAVTLDKEADGADEAFVGQCALRRIQAEGVRRRRVGLLVDGRRTPRQGMPVRVGDTVVGHVTSGCISPSLQRPIAMAYVDAAYAADGDTVNIVLQDQGVEAEITPLPFYRAKPPK